MSACIQSARTEYEELGFDTLPLTPGTKDHPLCRGWQRATPFRMWHRAPEDANIGIRFGGESHLACIECDDHKTPGTYINAQNLLFGFGLEPGSYPEVVSASGGSRHLYIVLNGMLTGNYRKFAEKFGSGEFRYGPGSYTAAPPSRVGEGIYTLVSGDFRQLPRLSVPDVLSILANQDTTPDRMIDSPNIPRRAMAMLHGKYIDNYSSRSEAEQALLTSLINAGFSFESILELFISHPCAGKFAELRSKSEKNAIRWLRHSFNEAKEWAENHESPARKTAQAAISIAESTPWAGRTGPYDRAVFIAHMQIAYKAGKLVWAASSRDLAELAGVSHPAASNATRRLCGNQYNLLARETDAVADCAAIYRLENPGQTLPLPHRNKMRECKSLSNHDVFRFKGLGKSAAEVWAALQEKPATEAELAERTGRHKRTVVRALNRMSMLVDSSTGEVVSMVEKVGESWYALDVDLDIIATLVGTSGAGKQQREKHQQERRVHRRALVRFSSRNEQ